MRITISVRKGTPRQPSVTKSGFSPFSPDVVSPSGYLLPVSPADHFRASYQHGYVSFTPLRPSQLARLHDKIVAGFNVNELA